MTYVDRVYSEPDLSPIDIVEDLAEMKRWQVERPTDDQIAMAVSGAWRTYSLSLAWFEPDETLRMVCSFELEAEEEALPEFYKVLDAANDRMWGGVFNYWKDQHLVAFRYGLNLRGGALATWEQVDAMLRSALENCERYYPAFQLVARERAATDTALSAALLEAAGRA